MEICNIHEYKIQWSLEGEKVLRCRKCGLEAKPADLSNYSLRITAPHEGNLGFFVEISLFSRNFDEAREKLQEFAKVIPGVEDAYFVEP